MIVHFGLYASNIVNVNCSSRNRGMDIEKGRSSRGATTSRLFAVTSTLMSCVALAGMVVLFVQNQQMQANVKQISAPKNVRIPDAARQERALQEVRIVFGVNKIMTTSLLNLANISNCNEPS